MSTFFTFQLLNQLLFSIATVHALYIWCVSIMEIIIFSTKDCVPVVRNIRNLDIFNRETMYPDYRGSTVYIKLGRTDPRPKRSNVSFIQ